MGRPKGFTLSPEQKVRMKESIENRKNGVKVEKEIKTKTPGKRGRGKGHKQSQEEIEKAKATRLKNKKIKAEIKTIDKPVLEITDNLKTGFDFWPIIRNVLRPLHRCIQCKKIERKIVKKAIWDKQDEVIKILENYFMLKKI